MHLLGRSSILRSSLPIALLAILVISLDPRPIFAKAPNISGGNYDTQPKASRYPGPWWSGTLSGTMIRASATTTRWYLYPGACADRALGSWAPKTSPVADSLNSYADFSTDTYTTGDQSLSEHLWHVADTLTATSQRPTILDGNRSLWCGTYNPAWVLPVGYPNVTYQILYIDTGTHGATYNLTLKMNASAELHYDFLYLIGGGGVGAVDPLGNDRSYFDNIIASGVGGPSGDSDLLVSWTGSITSSTPGALTINATAGTVNIQGAASGPPATIAPTITIPADHRAL